MFKYVAPVRSSAAESTVAKAYQEIRQEFGVSAEGVHAAFTGPRDTRWGVDDLPRREVDFVSVAAEDAHGVDGLRDAGGVVCCERH
jgi:hypothetical protein